MSNKSVIAKGHKKAETIIKNYLCAIGEKYAKLALFEAVEGWDETAGSNANLTGNTRTGFCAAVYYNGKLEIGPITVFDLDGSDVKRPTHEYTRPGDSGFEDYGSGEYIGSEYDPYVRKYSSPDLAFQPTQQGGLGYLDTIQWLSSHRPSGTGLVVVVANAVPYAGYLREARKLDILDRASNSSTVKTNLLSAFNEVRFVDYEKI